MESDPSAFHRLDGIKAIARYLDVSAKTVERWEKLYGLPVRREARGTRAVVFALRAELDDWRLARESRPDLISEEPSELPSEAALPSLRFVTGLIGRLPRAAVFAVVGGTVLLCGVLLFGRLSRPGDPGAPVGAAVASPSWPEDNLIANGGFEAWGPVGRAHPAVFATWSGDLSAIVSEQHGVTPAEGSHMLRFIATRPERPSSDTAASELWQLVDLRKFERAIRAGRLEVIASCLVNRVPGNEFTDSDFSIRIYAFDGDLVGWPDRIDRAELCTVQELVDTDADVRTWQPLTVRLKVPVKTRFLAIDVSALENQRNDAEFPELDGHYVDAITLVIESETVSKKAP